MIDSILIANSGLSGHERALRTVSDNVANMNTVGYKGAAITFSDVFLSQDDNPTGDSRLGGSGGGLDVLGTSFNFKAGSMSQTGRSLDTAITGPGFFVVQDPFNGHILYTKNGSFKTDNEGRLVTTDNQYLVMGLNSDGSLSPIETSSMQFHAPQATTEVTLTGLLSSSASTHTINDIQVFDAGGSLHKLSMQLDADSTLGNGTWTVTIMEGGQTLLTGEHFVILSSGPDPTASEIRLELEAEDGAKTSINFSLGVDVRSGLSSGNSSTLKVREIDGFSPGTANAIRFDPNGLLTVDFTNGESKTGQQLALAEFVTTDDLSPVSGAFFQVTHKTPMRYTAAGVASVIASGTLELSNVDLTSQFSELVLIQRGYQASSQILSAANEMLQELFNMRGSK